MVLNESNFSVTGCSGGVNCGSEYYGFIKDLKFLEKIMTSLEFLVEPYSLKSVLNTVVVEQTLYTILFLPRHSQV